MISAVVFDLYGTLLRLQHDSRPYVRLAEAQFSTLREITKRALMSNAPTIAAFAAEVGADCSQTATLDAKLRSDLTSAALFDDTIPCLSQLQASGLKLGLLSNVATPYKQPFFSLALDSYFRAAIFSCDIGARKPDQLAFVAVVSALVVPPKEVLMVGDSLTSDIAGAHAMGMQALLLDRTGTSGAPGTITSLGEIIEAMQGM
jgi:HAD superfamily hydrolase (TIGR01549 family)